jgi:hypothetical protein
MSTQVTHRLLLMIIKMAAPWQLEGCPLSLTDVCSNYGSCGSWSFPLQTCTVHDPLIITFMLLFEACFSLQSIGTIDSACGTHQHCVVISHSFVSHAGRSLTGWSSHSVTVGLYSSYCPGRRDSEFIIIFMYLQYSPAIPILCAAAHRGAMGYFQIFFFLSIYVYYSFKRLLSC